MKKKTTNQSKKQNRDINTDEESDVDGDDMDDDVIVISDEEDCTDITEFQSYEKTQIVTLTFKRKVRLVNGVEVIENFGCVVHREEFIN